MCSGRCEASSLRILQATYDRDIDIAMFSSDKIFYSIEH